MCKIQRRDKYQDWGWLDKGEFETAGEAIEIMYVMARHNSRFWFRVLDPLGNILVSL